MTLLFFGFTHCPDVCPTALADMRNVRRELGGDAELVQVVLITLDPERDTPERRRAPSSRRAYAIITSPLEQITSGAARAGSC